MSEKFRILLKLTDQNGCTIHLNPKTLQVSNEPFIPDMPNDINDKYFEVLKDNNQVQNFIEKLNLADQIAHKISTEYGDVCNDHTPYGSYAYTRHVLEYNNLRIRLNALQMDLKPYLELALKEVYEQLFKDNHFYKLCYECTECFLVNPEYVFKTDSFFKADHTLWPETVIQFDVPESIAEDIHYLLSQCLNIHSVIPIYEQWSSEYWDAWDKYTSLNKHKLAEKYNFLYYDAHDRIQAISDMLKLYIEILNQLFNKLLAYPEAIC